MINHIPNLFNILDTIHICRYQSQPSTENSCHTSCSSKTSYKQINISSFLHFTLNIKNLTSILKTIAVFTIITDEQPDYVFLVPRDPQHLAVCGWAGEPELVGGGQSAGGLDHRVPLYGQRHRLLRQSTYSEYVFFSTSLPYTLLCFHIIMFVS